MEYKIGRHIRELPKISYIKESGDEDAPAPALVPAPEKFIDCALGVNPFGCPPAAARAVQSLSASELARYPAFPYAALRGRIADLWRETADVPAECVRLGSGAMCILNHINKLFLGAGSRVLGYCPQFTDYVTNVYGYGGSYDFYLLPREKNYAFDPEAFLALMKRGHALVYLDNPNNPTGQVIPVDAVRAIAARARKLGACVIVDEAYGDYMPPANSAAALVPEFDNLFVVKSFSKGYGLAGLRAGYLIACGRLMEYYQRVDIPFSIGACAEAALGAALSDGAFLAESVRRIGGIKAEVMRACEKLACAATGKTTSILLLSHPEETADLFALFLARGVVTEAGDGFFGLSRSAVRLRVPADPAPLIDAIRGIEHAL